jgi:hypothetical protein
MTEIEKPLKSQVMADVVQKWYADFVDLEQVLLFELILAANYMDIKPLLDLTCATILGAFCCSKLAPRKSHALLAVLFCSVVPGVRRRRKSVPPFTSQHHQRTTSFSRYH